MLIKRDLAKEPMHALCVCRVFFVFFFYFLGACMCCFGPFPNAMEVEQVAH